jgi:hypothetical protein
MQVRHLVGTLFLVTALVTGYWEFYLMVRPLIGGPWSWWYPTMFGASTLLLVGGILLILPRMKKAWLVALALAVPLILCAPFGVSLSCGIFVAAIGFITWAALSVASAFKRPSVVPLTASVPLAVWWIPASAYNVRIYFSPNPPSPDAFELLWALVACILVIGSLIASAASLRSSVAGG